jgi:hypothetical protein
MPNLDVCLRMLKHAALAYGAALEHHHDPTVEERATHILVHAARSFVAAEVNERNGNFEWPFSGKNNKENA